MRRPTSLASLALLSLLGTAGAAASPDDDASRSRVRYPIEYPTTPTTCTYSGVFPLAGEIGQWTLTSDASGEHTTTLATLDHVRGILEGRLSGHSADEITAVNMRTTERRKGRLLDIRDDLDVTFLSGGANARFVGVAKTQHVCDAPSGVLSVGTTVGCTSSTRDTWTVEGAISTSGSSPQKASFTVEFLRREAVETPFSGAIDCDVIQTVWDDGLTTLTWHDPEHPWCPVKVERRRLDRVIGTDDLRDRRVTESVRIEPQKTGLDLTDMAVRLLIGGLITIGAAFGLAQLGHRRRPR